MTEAQIAAIAGEHYVAHKIAMLGYVPTLVRQRMPRIDLLVSSTAGDRTIGIQVKSALNATREPGDTADSAEAFALRFPLGHRAITSSAENTFFCFVDLRRMSPSAPPDVYVISSTVLKQEYEGVYLRKYSQLHYQRPWQLLQPFRNNWEPIERALSPQVDSAPPYSRGLSFGGFGRRAHENVIALPSKGSAAR